MRHIVIIMSQSNRVINAFNPLSLALFTRMKESKKKNKKRKKKNIEIPGLNNKNHPNNTQ